ncbi:MAG: hypothetical protein GY710_20105 [Desulfobacteraceae bacterium]|nr:hypothetical protein [Desulfobacteraceae bacterium]
MSVRIFVIVFWSACFAGSYYSLKQLMVNMPSFEPTLLWGSYFLRSVFFYVTVVCYPVMVLLSCISLRLMPVSSAGPIFMILGTIISIILGIFFFSEEIGTLKLAGIIFCGLGIILLIAGTVQNSTSIS